MKKLINWILPKYSYQQFSYTLLIDEEYMSYYPKFKIIGCGLNAGGYFSVLIKYQRKGWFK